MAVIASGAHRCAGRAVRSGWWPRRQHRLLPPFVSFPTPNRSDLLPDRTETRHLLPDLWFSRRTHVASVMARSGRRPAAPRSSEPQRCRRDFLPLG